MKDVVRMSRDEGLDGKRAIHRHDDFESLPEREGIRRPYTGWRCRAHINSTLVSRFLESHVGEKWDDIYSEICKWADRRSWRGYKLRESFGWLVDTWEQRENRRSQRWGWTRDFYVDASGMLRKEKDHRWKYRKPTPDPDKCYIEGRRFERINGCWFEVWYKKERRARRPWGFFQQRHVIDLEWEECCEKKKQLNSKELRDLGLSNKSGWKWYAA